MRAQSRTMSSFVVDVVMESHSRDLYGELFSGVVAFEPIRSCHTTGQRQLTDTGDEDLLVHHG